MPSHHRNLQSIIALYKNENSTGPVEKTENSNSWVRGVGWVGVGWRRLAFKLFFSYTIKNTCVYIKSKIKANVKSKQNLEHLKMISQRLSSSWAILIRAVVFSSSPRANFYSFEYLCFSFLLIFWFILT